MNRRQCLTLLGASSMAASRLIAQSRRLTGPTIRLFGIAFVKEQGDVVTVVMPASAGHKTFVVGLKSTVEALCGGTGTAKPAADYNLGVGHADLDLVNNPQAYAGCLQPRELALKPSRAARGVIDAELKKALPDVLALAGQISVPQTPYSLWSPQGSVTLYLSGGTLVHTTPSKNPGAAADIDWTFAKGSMPLAVSVPRLADVADFLSVGPASLATLNQTIGLRDDERVWFVNVPVSKEPDANPQAIEHIHEYLDCVRPVVDSKGVVARTAKAVTRPPKGPAFTHPCSPGERAARWYPPDSDPCFMMTF